MKFTYQGILDALNMIIYGTPPPETTAFSKLSKEAQEAIVWSVCGDIKNPPALSDSVMEEIRIWALKDET